MSKSRLSARTAALALLLLCACERKSAENLPPPLPVPAAPDGGAVKDTARDGKLPAKATQSETLHKHASASSPKEQHNAKSEEDDDGKATRTADRGLSLYELAKRGEAKLPATEPSPAPAPRATPSEVAAPAPVAPRPAAVVTAGKPRGSVTVPSTGRVHIDVPSAMQANLDADPRMQPWLNKVVSVVDTCFAKLQAQSADVHGTIEVTVTMRENERPDADIRSLPPQLSSLVSCATGALMRSKMPLFTGPEGQRHNVRLRFGE
jgi:hypothetical protein